MGSRRQQGLKFKQRTQDEVAAESTGLKEGDADWSTPCQSCDEVPTVHPTRLCGPCCFGDAHTAGGNW